MPTVDDAGTATTISGARTRTLTTETGRAARVQIRTAGSGAQAGSLQQVGLFVPVPPRTVTITGWTGIGP